MQYHGWSNPYQHGATSMYTGPMPSQSNVIKVMGEESAKAYPIGRNSSLLLVDENQPYVYLKTSDDGGFAQMKKFKIELVQEEQKTQPSVDTSQFVTKQDFDEFKKMIEDLVMANG